MFDFRIPNGSCFILGVCILALGFRSGSGHVGRYSMCARAGGQLESWMSPYKTAWADQYEGHSGIER